MTIQRWMPTAVLLVTVAASFATVQANLTHLRNQSEGLALNIAAIQIARGEEREATVRMQTQLEAIRDQLDNGILPVAQRQIDLVRNDIQMAEQRTGATVDVIAQQLSALTDRTARLSNRVFALEGRRPIAPPGEEK